MLKLQFLVLACCAVLAAQNRPPQVGPATIPANGYDPFVLTFTDPDGASDISALQVVVNSALGAAQSCYLYVDRPSSLLYLATDSGSWMPGVKLGSTAVLSNSRCSVPAALAALAEVNGALRLTLGLSFRAGFPTGKGVYAAAGDASSAWCNWTSVGAYTQPPNTTPSVSAAYPAYGMAARFRLTAQDDDGAADLSSLQLLVGSSQTLAGACAVRYTVATGQLWLADDAGAWQGPATPGQSGTLQNSQCALDAAASTFAMTYRAATIDFALSFRNGFAGTRSVYFQGDDSAGHTTGWLTGSSPFLVSADGNYSPGRPSVSPQPAGGSASTLTFTFSDPNGYADLATLSILIGSSTAPANSCYARFERAANQLFLADDAGNWQGPVTPGTSASLSNSRCSVSALAANVKLSSPDAQSLQVAFPLTFTNVFKGVQKIFASAVDSRSAATGWVEIGSYTAPGAPTVAVSPVQQTGYTQTFQFLFTDPDGYADVVDAQMDIATSLAAANACYLYFHRATGKLWLANDAGTWIQTPLTIGAAGKVSNSQCTVDSATSQVIVSGNTLSVLVPVTFSAGWTGARKVYATASDTSGASSGWQQVGLFTVIAPPANSPPSAVSVTPNAGSGTSQVFKFVFTDPDGTAALDEFQMVVGNNTSGVASCHLYYRRVLNAFTLANDAGQGLDLIVAGRTGTLNNSQCTFDAAGAGATVSGNNVEITVPLTFSAGFAGTKNIWGWVKDYYTNSGFQQLGTFTVPAPAGHAPSVVSVTPAAGSGMGRIFDFTFADANGGADIAAVQVVVNTDLAAANSCYLYFSRAANAFVLASDAGTWQGWVTAGSSSTTGNSRCTLNAVDSKALVSGNTLTLSVSLSFTDAFRGVPKKIWALAEDSSSGSGWQLVGTYNVIAESNFQPQAGAVTPANGSGSSQVFEFAFNDLNGYTDMTAGEIVINDGLGAVNSCYIYFSRAAQLLALADDAGRWQAVMTPGSPATSSNSRCTLDAAASSITGSGTILTVRVSLSFAASNTGNKSIFATVYDRVSTSNWAKLGTFAVTSAAQSRAPAVLSVAPNTGSGNSQAFQFTFTDPDGFSDIKSAQFVINEGLSTASSCYIYFWRASNTFALASDAGVWLTPVAAGTSTSSSNSRCTLNAATSGSSGSANTLTVTVSVTFASAFTGSKKIWAMAEDGTSDSGWQLAGNWTATAPVPNRPPELSLYDTYPKSAGSEARFYLTYSDTGGWNDIRALQFVINDGLSAANSCYVYMSIKDNTMTLADDAGHWQTPITIGSSATLSNRRCTLRAATSLAGKYDSTSVVFWVSLGFFSRFAGTKGVWAMAEDSIGNSGWQQVGNFTVLSTNSVPDFVQLIPSSASGRSQVFGFTYFDQDGRQDLASAFMVFNSAFTTTNSCSVRYDWATNSLNLADDSGQWQSPIVMGSAGVLSNTRCTLDAAGSSLAVLDAKNVQVRVSLTFTDRAAGVNGIWTQVADELSISAWRNVGSYTVN